MFSLSLFFKKILLSSFHQDSNKAVFAENMQTAPACESAEALGAQQKRKGLVPFRYSRAMKAHGGDSSLP